MESQVSPENDGENSMDNTDTPQEENRNISESTQTESPTETQETCCTKLKGCMRVQPALIPIKLFYLSFIGGIGCVLPYISVFLKQIGLGPQQIGLISGIRPIVGFLSAPLWGACGDRFKIRRLLLLISITAWLAFYFGFYFIPSPKRRSDCPPELENTTQANNTSPESLESYHEVIAWLYVPSEVQVVFLISLFVIVGGEFFQSPTTALSDAGTLQVLGRDGLANYGAQRAWGAIGWGVSSFLGGSIVSSSRTTEVICGIELHFSDYRILTYIFTGFMVVSLISAFNIKFKDNETPNETTQLQGGHVAAEKLPPGDASEPHSTSAVLRLFMNVHYGSWITTAFYVGVCNGVIWGFLYWHLENLGADQLLMGVDSVVTCAAEFFAFFLVGPLLRVISHMDLMYLGLAGYIIRFCVYGAINNPWLVVPADILQGVTFSCIWVSLTSYTAESVPSSSFATIQGILHGAYFGLGSGTGHLAGGLMIGAFGAHVTFFAMAGATAFVLALFLIAQKLSDKPSFIMGYEDLDMKVKEGN